MSEEITPEVAGRAAARSISTAGADFPITGKLWSDAAQVEGVDAGTAAARAEQTGIDPATAAFLLAPTAQGLGMLATAVKPIRQ